MIELKYPINNSAVSIQTREQRKFIEDEERRANMDGALTFQWYDLEKIGTDRSLPDPISFSWLDSDEGEDSDKAYFFLLISENEDMRDAWCYITNENSLDVYNLKVGTKYFWCVQKNGRRTNVSSFQVLPTLPRCLKIDGTSNVRDLGGYSVKGGKIRQGLAYRGGEFELHMHLTPSGISELQRLRLKTELDMRGEAKDKVDFTTVETIGIKRIFVPSVPYTSVFDKQHRAALKNFYRTFAGPKNYPIYFHCWGGADRTGTFAFILGAFLGMSYEDLIFDYEFTSLSIWGARSRNYSEFQKFLDNFISLKGTDLSEKARTFLKDYAGLTDKQLSTIYEILVKKTTP